MKKALTTYQSPVRVTLSVSQWLTVRIALGEAQEYNRVHCRPLLAAENQEAYELVKASTDKALRAVENNTLQAVRARKLDREYGPVISQNAYPRGWEMTG